MRARSTTSASCPAFQLRARFPQIGALQPQGARARACRWPMLEAAALSLQAQAGAR